MENYSNNLTMRAVLKNQLPITVSVLVIKITQKFSWIFRLEVMLLKE